MTPAAPPDPPATPARTRRPGVPESILAALVAFHGIVLLPALWRDTLAASIEGSPDWAPWWWTFANPARLLLSPALLVVLAALLVAVLAVLLARRAPRFAAWGSVTVAVATVPLVWLTGRYVAAYDATWWFALAAVGALQAADRRGWGPTAVAVGTVLTLGVSGMPVALLSTDGPTTFLLGADDINRTVKDRTTVVVVVLIAIVLAILTARTLAAAAGRHERRREALDEALRLRAEAGVEHDAARRLSATVTERSRVARDLHDVVAHHVSLVAVRAESARYATPDLAPATTEALSLIADDARAALTELRAVLAVLARTEHETSELRPQPSAAQLGTLLDVARSAGQDVTVRPDGPALEALVRTVPSQSGYVLYRVLQEALTNARRHAPGERVDVTITREPSSTSLVARNAAPADGHTPGIGLTGLAERVALVAGTSDVTVADGTFTLRVTLPDPDDVTDARDDPGLAG
ncbi:hypothetical protein IGS67_10755 [Flavimobilis sp. GY10621]|uniref:histidine kinase n=1 Tax=Flavimobilis rhizosphaerae TaxID=2775421 RepID=A0ABR9DS67_9MICO|nr:histidine kinase [Flavimobilis rhizosphaerae]MBD9699966.1 hypothetical protein [Flavimobilis rhizosphaerae]